MARKAKIDFDDEELDEIANPLREGFDSFDDEELDEEFDLVDAMDNRRYGSNDFDEDDDFV